MDSSSFKWSRSREAGYSGKAIHMHYANLRKSWLRDDSHKDTNTRSPGQTGRPQYECAICHIRDEPDGKQQDGLFTNEALGAYICL